MFKKEYSGPGAMYNGGDPKDDISPFSNQELFHMLDATIFFESVEFFNLFWREHLDVDVTMKAIYDDSNGKVFENIFSEKILTLRESNKTLLKNLSCNEFKSILLTFQFKSSDGSCAAALAKGMDPLSEGTYKFRFKDSLGKPFGNAQVGVKISSKRRSFNVGVPLTLKIVKGNFSKKEISAETFWKSIAIQKPSDSEEFIDIFQAQHRLNLKFVILL